MQTINREINRIVYFTVRKKKNPTHNADTSSSLGQKDRKRLENK